MTATTYIIPAINEQTLMAKLDKLNRKASKFGVAPVTVSDRGHDHWETVKHEDSDVEFKREWVHLTLTAQPVTVGDYRFVATLYHTSEGTVVMGVPSMPVPAWATTAPSACHHCKTMRKRNDTYVVQSLTTGEFVQVGSDCLQDFLGNDPHRVAQWAEYLGAFGQWCSGDAGNTTYVPAQWSLLHVLEVTASVARQDGWLSRSKANELNDQYPDKHYHSTSSTVGDYLTRRSLTKHDREFIAQYRPTDSDKATAQVLYDWAQTLLETTSDNDYLRNLVIVVKLDIVPSRLLGIACSIFAAHRMATQKREERAAAAENPSRHVGTEGERLRNVPVTVTSVRELPPNDYGSRWIVTMKDNAGNLFCWFSGSVWKMVEDGQTLESVVGATRILTGTVKRHGEFNGVQQTELSRCVLSIPATKEAA